MTIWVDDEELPAGSGQKPLAQGSVSTTVHVTNGVPVIAERAMWWPGPETTANFWYEAHNSPGATGVATRWVVPGVEVGGAEAAESYVLIANTSTTDAVVQMWLVSDDSTSLANTYRIAAKSRTTVNVGQAFTPFASAGRYSVVIESAGLEPVPVVVERATYTSPGGVFWAAGGNALAAPVP
jgi:hypothetical protein